METREVVVIGSGFGGLCAAIRLRAAGIDDLVILEQSAEPGGTWQVNDYPGCACDVPSHLYSFSFAQHPDWTRRYPRRDELWAYTRRIIADYGLAPLIRVGTRVGGAVWDAAAGLWRLDTSRGALAARVLVAAIGPLSRPARPAIAGLDRFQGPLFHSARWDHGCDLAGKRVAVIGTGASAVQFVPEIAPRVARLDLYQRTAPWVLPRPDRAISAGERWLLRHVKPARWLYRGLTYLSLEAGALALVHYPGMLGLLERLARRHIARRIADPALRRRVTPDYTIGCKRILLSNDYYPALNRPNVTLVTSPISEIRGQGVVTADGRERPADIVILGTGFDLEGQLGSLDLVGRGGRRLGDLAPGGLDAYKGAAITGFPNFFMITGPNTGLGHNSMIYMIESGVAYVVQAVQALRREKLRSVEIDAGAQRAFNDRLQARLAGTVWNSGCRSWYLARGGKNFTIWPGFTFQYRRATRRFDLESYRVEPRG